MLLDEVGGYLAAQSLASSSGANGWVLYKGWLPDSTVLADKAVALIETGGMPPSPGRIEVEYPTFQVKVRGGVLMQSTGAYLAARTEAEAIKTALHGLGPVQLPSSSAASAWYYRDIVALQSPAFVGMDAQQRPVFVCNYRADRSRTS